MTGMVIGYFVYLYRRKIESMAKDSLFSDRELLELINRGDQAAFTVLFERYRNHLYNYLLKITKSCETSEEIVVDVFMKIWQGRSLAAEIDNFEAFLFSIARNKAIDFLRWLEKRKSQQIELWSRMQESPLGEPADAGLRLTETRQQIDEAVMRLSPQRKQVFELSRSEGLTYEEIARRMHISSHTVRNHIAASLAFIRYHISAEMGLVLACWVLVR